VGNAIAVAIIRILFRLTRMLFYELVKELGIDSERKNSSNG